MVDNCGKLAKELVYTDEATVKKAVKRRWGIRISAGTVRKIKRAIQLVW